MNRKTVSALMRAQIPMPDPEQVRAAEEQQRTDYSRMRTEREEVASQPRTNAPAQPPRQEPVRSDKTVGRNDPCPCGSGKKFKACHGR